ncbi:transporter substrate-binding domain-containing protein [Phyllobacterium calauticae]|jgi:polar amino acid transport system substrate-binding protein|uniref:transporter substrate-binding domain-containing protein n=1 Tax=Phyllobacterium calauticae TaxID=2817027 RepID=UPI001CC1127C|nr:transporter substrate-binding domain-containing protein [Phyllobacterium calauticae]MBZ3695918.1 transporter substrate-binding domain-containing protein [Phyllobacterium calauticae]
MKPVNDYKVLLATALLSFSITSAMAEQRILKIGTDGLYPPFSVVDNAGKVTGLDIEIGNAICAKLGAKCQWTAQDFEGLIPAVQNGRYDMVIASHSITDERKKAVDMIKYYNNSASFLVPKNSDGSDLSPAAFAGKSVGAQTATVHASYLEKNFSGSTLKFYPSQIEAYADLSAGRIDAVMGDTPTLYTWVQGEGKDCCKISEAKISDPSIGDGAGIVVKKDNEPLHSEVQKAVDLMWSNGEFDALWAQYFPFRIGNDK